MELFTATHTVKCDVKNCNNTTNNYFLGKGTLGRLFICNECLSQIVDAVLPTRTPKSPKNTIKKIIDKKEEENNAEIQKD